MTRSTRMPTFFIPHGGGPWPFVDLGLPRVEVNSLASFLRWLPGSLGAAPKAILVISAHWEEAQPTLMTHPNPPMYFDYYGFPGASYQLSWPAPGEPQLATRVASKLNSAGFSVATNTERGFDHGTFIPLMLSWPEAQIPTLQLSLIKGLDPAAHLRLGAALAPLRDEGVLILGSGMSFHNMRGFRDPRAVPPSEAFDGWLQREATAPPAARRSALTKWTEAPFARICHPREEHLLPLHVVAGAAEDDPGKTVWSGSFMGLRLSAFQFGA
jgi:aromatic ring-opening dioxygenase catalytic subunit (LigB family)